MTFGNLESIYLKLQTIQEIMNLNLARVSKDYKLNVTELMMTVDIKNYPHTDLQSVCNRLGIKKSMASKTLKKLVEEGVILRTPDTCDQRKLVLSYNNESDIAVCKENALSEAFNADNKCNTDLKTIESSLDDLLEMLSSK